MKKFLTELLQAVILAIMVALLGMSIHAYGADNVGKFDTITTNNPSRATVDILKDTKFTSTGAIYIPVGTTGQRPGALANGAIRVNSTLGKVELYYGGQWSAIAGGLSDWVTATAYQVGDVVIENYKIYQCLIAHTSGTFATDLANGDWVELSATGTINLATQVTGVLPIANGGTGSATKNFVDLSTAQSVAGAKTFSDPVVAGNGLSVSGASSFAGDISVSGNTTLNTSLTGLVKAVSGVVSASQLVNADVSSSAAIEYSKLAPLSTGQVLLGNAGVPTATTLSGGATVGATGVVTLGNSAVISQLLTGYTSGAGTVSSSDSILQALQKIDGNDKLKLGLTKSDSDVSAVTTTQLNVPNSQLTTSGANTRRIETGNDNLLKNPSFEATTVGSDWTAVNGSCASSSGVTVDGNVNCSFTSSGTNWSLSQCSTTNAPRLAGQEMENSVWIGSASTSDPIWVCPGTNGSYPTPSVANGCMQYTNIGSIQLLKNYFLGDSASTSNCIRISGSNSGTTVGIDKAYTGLRNTSEVSGELNTPWVPCTFSSLAWTGFATVTNNLQCKRSGPNLQIKGTFTTGTSTGSTVVIPLPNNFGSISLRVNGTYHVGSYFRSASSVAHGGAVIALTGTDTLNLRLGGSFAFGDNNFNPMASAIGTEIAVSGETLSLEANIPIAEWKNNINAFSTKCDDPRQCETVFSANFNSAGVVSNQSTGASFPWISGNASVASGTYTIPLTTNLVTVGMNCSVTLITGSQNNIIAFLNATSSNNIVVILKNTSGTQVADPFTITCQKQGIDYLNSRITQQIVQMRGVPTVPGASGGIDTFRISYGATATTNCTSGTCPYIDFLGGTNPGFSVSVSGVNYTLTTPKTYIQLKCSIDGWNSTVAAVTGIINGTNSNSFSFTTLAGAGSLVNSWGTIDCMGKY